MERGGIKMGRRTEMQKRLLVTFVVAVASVIALVSITVHGQPPSAAKDSKGPSVPWKMPRTAWGDPDLQGVWDSLSATPLERPQQYGGRELLTDQEFARQQQQVQGRNADRPPREGDPGTYNGFWVPKAHLSRRTSLVIDPPDGQLPAFTDAANKRFEARLAFRRGRGEADSPQDRNLWERCISFGGLPTAMHTTAYNGGKQIFQTKNYVAIHIEMIHDWRIIPLDNRPHLPSNIRQWMGDSRGHWEGDTLVVETTNFVDRLDGGPIMTIRRADAWYQGSGATLKLIEHFTRVDDDTIDYRYTVDDPEVYVRPYTVALPFTKDNTQNLLFEYACHEGNHAMRNILSGARHNEAEALKAAEQEEARLRATRGRHGPRGVD
jgi:hypothetical protein